MIDQNFTRNAACTYTIVPEDHHFDGIRIRHAKQNDIGCLRQSTWRISSFGAQGQNRLKF